MVGKAKDLGVILNAFAYIGSIKNGNRMLKDHKEKLC
jgi:hypothetical protein